MADNREACPGLVWWSVTWSMTSVGDTDHTGADTGHDTTLEQHCLIITDISLSPRTHCEPGVWCCPRRMLAPSQSTPSSPSSAWTTTDQRGAPSPPSHSWRFSLPRVWWRVSDKHRHCSSPVEKKLMNYMLKILEIFTISICLFSFLRWCSFTSLTIWCLPLQI